MPMPEYLDVVTVRLNTAVQGIRLGEAYRRPRVMLLVPVSTCATSGDVQST